MAVRTVCAIPGFSRPVRRLIDLLQMEEDRPTFG